MAMIKCRECGEEMSDHAKSCPNCGMENSIMFCPECDKQLSSKATVCPSCGYDFKNKGSNTDDGRGENYGMAIAALICSFFGCVAVVGLVLGIIVLNSNEGKENSAKTLGIASIIISVISILITFIAMLVFMSSF